MEYLAGEPWDELEDALNTVGACLDALEARDMVERERVEDAGAALAALVEWYRSEQERWSLNDGSRSNRTDVVGALNMPDDTEANAEFAGRLHGLAHGWAAAAGDHPTPPKAKYTSVVNVFEPCGELVGVAFRHNRQVVGVELV